MQVAASQQPADADGVMAPSAPPQVDYRANPSFGGDAVQGRLDREDPNPAPCVPVQLPSGQEEPLPAVIPATGWIGAPSPAGR
jgi:hypothetical protein